MEEALLIGDIDESRDSRPRRYSRGERDDLAGLLWTYSLELVKELSGMSRPLEMVASNEARHRW
ncbi:MAG: hypothetical protein IPG98_04145 [Burkholderiales bacterium]|nr:hypothetical protein [Burkholderiales bacterium]MBK8665490.1 hypothetical protein [Burkholderiales bacterium]